MMARRMMRKHHVRCRAGEKVEITSKPYLKELYAKAQEAAQPTQDADAPDKDTFSIYQIKGGDGTRDFRFEPYDRLHAAGNVVDKAN